MLPFDRDSPAPEREIVDLSEEEGEDESHSRSSTCKDEKLPVGKRADGVRDSEVGVS